MSVPVYECPVCGTRQPVRAVDPDDPPLRLGNTQCDGAYGGCLRMIALEYVPEAEWNPETWQLFCSNCGYETVDWGEQGFGPTEKWNCPDCSARMHVTSVTHLDAPEE